MADDKRGRDKQARDQDRRQRERAMREEIQRGDEPEPPKPPAVDVDELDELFAELSYPIGPDELREIEGERPIESPSHRVRLRSLLPDEEITFDSPAAVEEHVREAIAEEPDTKEDV